MSILAHFTKPRLYDMLNRISFQVILTTYTSSEEENIFLSTKFAENIRKNDEGPKLFEDTAD